VDYCGVDLLLRSPFLKLVSWLNFVFYQSNWVVEPEVVHALRAYTESLTSELRVVLKLDFKNAFNSIHRDFLLHCIEQDVPELYPLAYQAYREPSCLFFGNEIVWSQNGVQQGDPAGPAFFCLGVKYLTKELRSEFHPWYLDDGTLAGTLEDVIHDLNKILEFQEISG